MQGSDPVPPVWREFFGYWLQSHTLPDIPTMNIQDIFYHGIRDQIRRVLGAMTEEEIDRGLTAFKDGASSWSHCFFARALPQLQLDNGRPEEKLVEYLQCGTVIPVRIVYCTFDGLGVSMTKAELMQFIAHVRLENDKALDAIKTINYAGVEDREITAGATCKQGDMYNSLIEDEFLTGQGGT